jgi:hypothetical protein
VIALMIVAPLTAIALALVILRKEPVEAPVPAYIAPVAEPEIAPRVKARVEEKIEPAKTVAPRPAVKTKAEVTVETKPVETPKAPEIKYPELRALLRALEQKPNDFAIAEELSKKIAAAADDIDDANRKKSIKRCALGALFPVDAAELNRCFSELISSSDG